MRRRAAIEPVIGHLKEDHRMRRNYLTGRDGDRINAVLAAAGYNFSLLLRWFEELLPALSLILWHALLAASLHLTRCRKTFFTADLVSQGLLSLAVQPPTWVPPCKRTSSRIHQAVLTQLRYDLSELKGHTRLQRDASRYAYRLTTNGGEVALLFLFFHKRLRGPLANSRFHHQPKPPTPTQQPPRNRLPLCRQSDPDARRCVTRAPSKCCTVFVKHPSG